MGMLDGKRILLCVSGGIAAYKAAELVRLMGRDGAEVRVAMTYAAQKFVSPLTFQSLSGKAVMVNLFDQLDESDIGHIEIARWAHCIVVAPATANVLGKLAHGIADDLVSTMLVATRAPVIFAPAMNWAMWQNEIVQENVKKLAGISRYSIVQPEEGDLACGETGTGRLAELETIVDMVRYNARQEQDLTGELVLVSAGATREDLDPVRYLSNRSSGKMGFAIAKEARARGARVVLVCGPNSLTPPADIQVIPVRSAAEMLKVVTQHSDSANIIIKSAAVADYRPANSSSQKIHKAQSNFNLALTGTVDILKTLGDKKKKNQFLVGFAAETQQVMESGQRKLKSKNLDMIVVNDISQEGAGFNVDTNVVRIIDRKGHIESLSLMKKSEVAVVLFDMIQKQRATVKPGARSGRRGNAGASRRGRRTRGAHQNKVSAKPEVVKQAAANDGARPQKPQAAAAAGVIEKKPPEPRRSPDKGTGVKTESKPAKDSKPDKQVENRPAAASSSGSGRKPAARPRPSPKSKAPAKQKPMADSAEAHKKKDGDQNQ